MGSFIQDGNDGKAGDNNYLLARQSSVFSLTFDEFQSTLGGPGKDFGSMNMEELLKSIWTAEESQGVGASAGLVNGGIVPSGNLQRQGSLTLPRTLSQKTVDQVWRDVLKETVGAKDQEPGTGGSSSNLLPREPTLGEITLEEFLFRAGVREGPTSNSPGIYVNDNMLLGVPSYTVGQTQQPQSQLQPLFPKQTTIAFSSPVQIRSNNNNGHGHHVSPETKSSAITSPLNNNAQQGQAGAVRGHNRAAVPQVSLGNHLHSEAVVSKTDPQSPSPPPYILPEGGRGRRSSTSLEKVVERRRRRMIKNRESAARSRARKQAYTLELEAEIAKLKATNQELQKKQDEYIEMQKNQSMETKNLALRGKRICLRRTVTGPW